MTDNHLILGTAQLGMPYGVANVTGKPDAELALRIVETAWKNGVREFDTAQAYGDSEVVLGKALAALGVSGEARVITKLDAAVDHGDANAVRKSALESLRKLGVPRLYGLMVHSEDHLGALKAELGSTLRSLVADGVVEHAGISLYSPPKALEALSLDVVDMIQVPANVLDRRMRDAGVFASANESGKRVYLRSVFLQGMLLMNDGELPARVGFARDVLKTFRSIANDYDVSPMRVALGYVRTTCVGARVVFGAERPEQVQENCRSWEEGVSRPLLARLENAFANVDGRIVDPRCWG